MREELLDAYYEAIENPDSKSASEIYREKSEWIGPNIVIDECLKVNELQEEVERLKKEVSLVEFELGILCEISHSIDKTVAKACIKIVDKYAFTSSVKAEIREKYGLKDN